MEIADGDAHSRSKSLLSGPALCSPSTAPSADVNPATDLLQDMIREKRAQTQRAKKTFNPASRIASGEKSTPANQNIQSSPMTSANSHRRPSIGSRRASGANGKPVVQKEMGLREMSDHICKVDKQNFDLKLEVFHRRQRNEVLEAKVEELEARETDYENLQAKYETLLLESDRQRLIIDDAVAQICELQSENEELQAMIGGHYAGLSGFEPVGTGESQETSKNVHVVMPSTPPQVIEKFTRPRILDRQGSVKHMRSTTSRRNLKATPSPREEKTKKNSSHSIYSSDSCQDQRYSSLLSVNRPGSVFSGNEEEDALEHQMLNSPRLSILSESGFSSIYGSPRDSTQASDPTKNDQPDNLPPSRTGRDPAQCSAQRDARIDLWIQEKSKLPTPATQSPIAGAHEHFNSIEQVLHKLPSVPAEHAKMPEEQIPPRQSSSAVKAGNNQRQREMRTPTKISTQRGRSLSSSDGSIAIGGKLPPTPETMSTATIGGPNSSTQSIIAEKSLLDHGQPLGKGYANLVAYRRPRTSDSDSPRSTNPAHNGLNGLGFDDEMGFTDEDDEMRSTAVEQGDRDLPIASPFTGGLVHQNRHSGSTSHVRPAISTHQTDMFFNGEGFALVQPSRTFSYPASRHSSNQACVPLSPNSQRGESRWKSSIVSDRAAQTLSPNYPSNSKNVTMTPIKSSLKDNESILPAKQNIDQGSPLSNLVKQQVNEPVVGTRPKSGRFLFFRRSNSQNADMLLNAQPDPTSRQQTFRSTSSTHAQSQLPEPGGSFGARPGTSDGSVPTVVARSSRSTNPRRHSAILDQATSFIPRATASIDHNRRLSESRQIFRTEDSKSRWPLGRSASAKIKEGLGWKRLQGP